jgi:hypothetical protein
MRTSGANARPFLGTEQDRLSGMNVDMSKRRRASAGRGACCLATKAELDLGAGCTARRIGCNADKIRPTLDRARI